MTSSPHRRWPPSTSASVGCWTPSQDRNAGRTGSSGNCPQRCERVTSGWLVVQARGPIVEPALSWLHGLRRTDRDTLLQVSQAVTALQEEGPALGRPLVDTIKGSALPNLEELHPGSPGATEVRWLFVFDPDRQAVIPVGGDGADKVTGPATGQAGTASSCLRRSRRTRRI
ncbi:type II toxin-antitoxin system RelE/ParE family toxin [Streptomyces sp. NPDC008092]|uniref:type II toxin-antitoxin system RelE/ParE family toxin n=1 Tax=Streptomyces sp. NPDC008092 TaxID=3364808 RepID=UPI0036E13DBB